jgi:hypothetical protein
LEAVDFCALPYPSDKNSLFQLSMPAPKIISATFHLIQAGRNLL